jgi:predicted nucleotidyltransferase
MEAEMTTQEVEQTLVAILKKHDASRIGIFGSRARGEARPGSDLDVLVDFTKTKSLLTLVGIEQELSEALGIKVDLLTEAAVSPHLIDRIKAELKVVYQ